MLHSLVQWSRFAGFLMAHAVALAALYVTLVEPALTFLSDQRRQIEAGVTRLDQVALAATRDSYVARLDPGDVSAAAQRFVQGSNEGLLSADLLTRLRQAADETGVSFTSLATLPPRDWFGRSLVGARVELVAPAEDLAKLISTIENGQSLLFIRRAKLSVHGEGEPDGLTAAAVLEVYGVTQWRKT